jgi:hypothetical protein
MLGADVRARNQKDYLPRLSGRNHWKFDEPQLLSPQQALIFYQEKEKQYKTIKKFILSSNYGLSGSFPPFNLLGSQ